MLNDEGKNNYYDMENHTRSFVKIVFKKILVHVYRNCYTELRKILIFKSRLSDDKHQNLVSDNEKYDKTINMSKTL